MDGIDILIYGFVIIFILIFIFTLVAYLLPDGKDYSPNRGTDSIGNWKLVNTNVGVLRSYYFRSSIMNTEGKYLDVNITSKTLTFGNPITWVFDGLRLYTETSDGFYYVNVSQYNTVYISKDVLSDWIYDGFNFYLNASLATNEYSYLNSKTLGISTVSKYNRQLYEPTESRWIVSNPFN